jgi:hypothetical protein
LRNYTWTQTAFLWVIGFFSFGNNKSISKFSRPTPWSWKTYLISVNLLKPREKRISKTCKSIHRWSLTSEYVYKECVLTLKLLWENISEIQSMTIRRNTNCWHSLFYAFKTILMFLTSSEHHLTFSDRLFIIWADIYLISPVIVILLMTWLKQRCLFFPNVQ